MNSKPICTCTLDSSCPYHGEFAKREANATSLEDFLPEIAVAEMESGQYVIVHESNMQSIMERLATQGKGKIACYRLHKVETVIRPCIQ